MPGGDAFWVAAVTALLNGAVTWGVVSVKLEWLRRDVDAAHDRLDQINAPPAYSARKHQR